MTRRLFFAMAGLAVVVLIVADTIGRHQVEVAERRGAVIDLERRAFRVALIAQDDLERQSLPGAVPLRPAESVRIHRLAVNSVRRLDAIAVVTDHRDRMVTTVARGVPRDYGAAISRRAPMVRGRGAVAARSERIGGVEYEIVGVPIVANIGNVGAVFLAQRSEVLSDTSRDRVAFLTPAFLAAIGLSVVLAFLLARALTRPLGQLVRASRRVARERGTAPSVEPSGPAEVRELAEAFNAMSLRVRELIDRQSQFASDVSHQLRTPLTTLGVAVERTRVRGGAGDIPGAGESLAAVQAEVTRLSQLVEGLLVLTRVPLADAVREPVDVAAVARDRAGIWRELAREHGVDLTVRAPAGSDAFAVPGAVDQILDNLLDNALEVAPVGSQIAIEVTGVGALVTLAVTDRGPGMSDADRARAFDRFWRADASRGEGIGIGLTIVRDLTEACGGDIELAPAEGGGTRAVLTLEAVPGRVPDAPLAATAGAPAMRARLRTRLRRYLRARDPDRAAGVEAEVWLACTQEGAEIDGCDDCATTVFTMAHDRMPQAPDGGPGGVELDAHLLRTLGGLDTQQIAKVLEVTPRTVERLERRAHRTLLPVVDGRSVPEPAPRLRVPRAARVGAIAAVAVVVATGTAAATGSLPDPVQHQFARVLRGVGVHVPDPGPDAPSGLGHRSDPAALSHTAIQTAERRDGAFGDDPAEPEPGDRPPTTTPAVPSEPDEGASAPASPGQTKQSGGTFVPPGQAKQGGESFVPPGEAKQSGATFVAPGQAKQTSEAASVPPGRAKQTAEVTSVPPGQAKVPPGQTKKSG